MKQINIKKQINSTVEESIEKIIDILKDEGFGVLTRIDLHIKIKEKIGKDIQPTIILGACNPALAFEAFQLNSDIASILPCNVVIRELEPNLISIEIAKPTSLMDMLGDSKLTAMALNAENMIKRVIDKI